MLLKEPFRSDHWLVRCDSLKTTKNCKNAQKCAKWALFSNPLTYYRLTVTTIHKENNQRNNKRKTTTKYKLAVHGNTTSPEHGWQIYLSHECQEKYYHDPQQEGEEGGKKGGGEGGKETRIVTNVHKLGMTLDNTWLTYILPAATYTPTTHVKHAASSKLPGAYFPSNSQGQTTEKYISRNMPRACRPHPLDTKHFENGLLCTPQSYPN